MGHFWDKGYPTLWVLLMLSARFTDYNEFPLECPGIPPRHYSVACPANIWGPHSVSHPVHSPSPCYLPLRKDLVLGTTDAIMQCTLTIALRDGR